MSTRIRLQVVIAETGVGLPKAALDLVAWRGGFINLFSTTKKLSLRLSVCPSVCPSCSLQQRAAGLLLRARRVGDIDRLLHCRRRSSTARAVSRLQLTYEAEEHRRVNFIVL